MDSVALTEDCALSLPQVSVWMMDLSLDRGDMEGFVRMPNRLLDGLVGRNFTAVQLRIILWVLRNTTGWNRNSTLFSWYQIAKDMALDRGGVVRTGHRLLEAGILFVEDNRVGIRYDSVRWQCSRLAPPGRGAMTPVSADGRQRRTMTTVSASDDACHRNRCQESSLFRRAKDSSKDRLKTYKDRQSHRAVAPHRGDGDNTERTHLAAAVTPNSGKYDGLSQN